MTGLFGEPRSAETHDWITPRHVIDDLGPFDLDPCASLTQPWPCAAESFTAHDNGMAQQWRGMVWLNPPYGDHPFRWLHRLADHGCGIALIFARVETIDFRDAVWQRADAVRFLTGRLTFHRPDGTKGPGNSGAPSVLVAYGAAAVRRLAISRLPGVFIDSWGTTDATVQPRLFDAK